MKTEPGQAENCDEDKKPAETAGVTPEPDFEKENNEGENNADNFEKEDSNRDEVESNENQVEGTPRILVQDLLN